MGDRFKKRDFVYVSLCILLIIFSLWFELNNYGKAFPEQTIKFDVDRKESRGIAEQFLGKLNIGLSDYHHAIAFDYDNASKVFIEKEVGVEESGNLLNKEFKIWHWSNRWFKSLSKEEFKVNVTPAGEITLFEHIIPEEASSPSLPIDEARRLSHTFLRDILEVEMGNWEFVDEKTEIKPNRVDYLFTYKEKGIEVYNATYRFEILVQGNKIGKYREYLKIPEEWKREYKHLRSLNTTTAAIAEIFFLMILIAALIISIIRISKRDVRLKTAVIFGVITFCLQLFSVFNRIPITVYNFDTNQSLGNFYGTLIILGILKSLFFGLLVTLIAGAGETLYRQHYTKKISLTKTFSLQGMRTKRFFFSLLVGISLAFLFMAFQTFFYLSAKRYGAWSPAEVPYSGILNTAFPWIFVIFAGFAPAVIEEFTFRMFSIPFLERLLKSKVLAILIPAAIWGFAHANYPNQPFWIRGVEVSIFGVIIGVVFLKLNILTVLVWHYTVDALYSSLILIRTGSTYLVISGALAAGIMFIPLLYNLFMYIKNGRFASSRGITNEIEGIVKPVEVEEEVKVIPEIKYKPLSKKRLRTGAILGLIFLITFFIPAEKVGEFYHYPVQKKEIINTAKKFIENKGVDPQNFKYAIGLEKNYESIWGKYAIENSSLEKLNTVLAQYLPNSSVWYVRFFKPLEKEEYRVYVNPMDNVVVSFNHIIEETAPGYTLTKENAILRAEAFLAQQDINLSEFELKEAFSQQLENRTDHTFIWEARMGHPSNINKGKLRFKIIVRGDEVSSFDRFYKLPEDWVRIQTQRTVTDSVRIGLQIGIIVALAVVAILFFLKKFKSQTVEWKPAIVVSLAIALLVILGEILLYKEAQLGYNTTWSLGVWNILWILLTLLKGIGVWGLTLLLIISIVVLYPHLLYSFRKDRRQVYSTDAVFSSALLIMGLFAISKFSSIISSSWTGGIASPNFVLPNFLASHLPPLNVFIQVCFKGVVAACVIGLITFSLKNIISKTIYKILIPVVLIAVFMPSNVGTIPEFLVNYISVALFVLWLWIGIKYFLKDNIPAYVCAGLGFYMVSAIVDFIKFGSPRGKLSAYFFILILVIGVIWILTEKRAFNVKSKIREYFKH